MDDRDPIPPQDSPPQPGSRLRRILKASQEEETPAPRADIPPTGTELPSGAEAFSTPEPEQPGPEQPPSGGYPEDPEATPPRGLPPVERHPTGQPDSTGGWYGESEPVEDQTQANPVLPLDASSEATMANPALPVEPSADKTRASLASDEIPTQPVKVRPRSEEPTIPPVATGAPPAAPLPQHVDQVDVNATRVTPAAYGGASPRPAQTRPSPAAYSTRPVSTRSPVPPPPTRPVTRRPAGGGRRTWGCLLRTFVSLLFVAVLLVLCAGSYGVYRYFTIARELPDVNELRNRASQFETTRILDRNGNVLYEILDPNAGRRTYVPLSKISPYMIAATIATEDKEFWSHPGFDPAAIVRALWNNYTTGDGGGASTITQQLARNLLLSPQERTERTVQRKAREIILAAEITRRYSKEDILELYLNENYYSNLAYGVEAAAETYFNTTAEKLTLSQASFLAGLPQAPGVYDIYQNREVTLNRHKQVLTLMYQVSQQDNCIDVGTQAQPVCVDVSAAQAAAKEIEDYPFQQDGETMRYPHWVTYIRSLLEAQFDAQTIYRSGFTVYTTLDPVLQDKAQEIVKQQVDTLADLHVTDGALVALRPSSGEILAMVGSADFNNEAISGQVNMAISPRQPGSSIKPLTYAAAFEKGWTPATLIWDVPSEFPPSGDPNDPRDPYVPQNYDGRFHGPVTVRDALANSYNIPAVKTLQYVGIYDNPNTPDQDGLINFARRMGITTLNRPDYGLSLTLGGGEVSVLDMTSAFGVFANNGSRVPPVAITRITDYTGNTVYEYEQPAAQQVIRPEHAYLINSILSDNEARTPMFGPNSVLNLPFQAAAKTGTTNDFRDNWTLGYTPDLVVGVWVGNADYTPMINTTGVTGAAPIWSQFMQFAVPTITGDNPTPFSRPPGIVEKVICSVSGTEPSEYCPSQRTEVFAADRLPEPKEKDLWQQAVIDTWTGLRASAACNDFTKEVYSLNVTDKWAKEWLRDTDEGRAWAAENGFPDDLVFTPSRECKLEDPHPTILFAAINEGQTINSNPMDIYAVINATDNFMNWRLQWGQGKDPAEWKDLVKNSVQQFKNPEKIYTWDLSEVPSDKNITLRIYMRSTNDDHYAERKITFRNMIPTPTPTMTPTPEPTETEIPTVTPSNTPEPTETEQPTATVQVQATESGSIFDWIPFFRRTATPTPP